MTVRRGGPDDGSRTVAVVLAGAGHSLRGLFGALRPVRMGWPRDDGEPPPWLDCDTPEAVDQARAWVSR